MEPTLNLDPLDLGEAALPLWDRKGEIAFNRLMAGHLIERGDRAVWFAKSQKVSLTWRRKHPHIHNCYTGVRENDLAFGPCGAQEPNVIVQVKYDKGPTKVLKDRDTEYCKTSPFLDALGDLVYVAVDHHRLLGAADCHVLSVVHPASLAKEGWGNVCAAPEESVWTLECEPKSVPEVTNNRTPFVSLNERHIRLETMPRVCRVFGTKFQRHGFGLFARPGKLTVRFTSRARKADGLWLVDWRVLDVILDGANDVPLAAWLP